MCASLSGNDGSGSDIDSGLIDAAYEQAVAGLGSSAKSPFPQGGPAPSPDAISGYRIVKEIHRGGQGVVYEALQESTRRNVAIKVMHEGPSPGARDKARFDREVHILGQLRHPNIVTVHDSGSSAGGFYFVMDYIHGEPLDAYVASKKLSIRDTMHLFAMVCEAVNVAHLRGVIHRDLKPSNIRVDRAGQPHILDFGLAKVAEFDALADSQNDARTMTGQFIGSLPWAAPEQVEIRRGGVDIRSDVYSLGVVLFQILCGRFPYDVVGNIRDVLENICNAEPPRPSTVRSGIDDEVEAITLRCLRKDKEHRYQSAGELARDVRRYLAGETIEAKRDSAWYVFRKTLRRYKGRAAVACMLFVFTVGSAIALAIWYQREKELRANAEQQEAVARAVVDFLTKDVLEAVRPYKQDREPTARELFDEASAKIAEGSFADHPLVEAELRSTLGVSYRWLGVLDEATSELRKALEVFRRELGNEHEKTLKAMYQLGGALSEMGALDEADGLLSEAVETQRRVLGPEHPATLSSENDYAGLLKNRGRIDEAIALHRQILETRLRVQGPEDRDTLTAMGNLATALKQQGKLDEAEPLFRRAFDTYQKTSGPRHSDTLVITMGLADVLRRQGKLDEAEPLARQAVEGLRAALGPAHDHSLQSMVALADIMELKNDRGEVERLLREALEAQRETGYENATTISLCFRLGYVLKRKGNLEESEGLFRRAVAVHRRIVGKWDEDAFIFMSQLGSLLLDRGKRDEAEGAFAEALDQCRRAFGDDDERTLAAIANFAVALLNEKPEQAEPLLREALDAHQRLSRDDDFGAGILAYNLATALHRQDKFTEAEPLYRDVLAKDRRTLGNRNPNTLRVMDAYACLLKDQKKLEEAEPLLREALETAEQIWPDGHFLVENYRGHWGECLTAMQRYAEAEEALLLSHQRLQELLPEGHRSITNRVRSLAELYDAWGKPEEAATWRAQLPEPSDVSVTETSEERD